MQTKDNVGFKTLKEKFRFTIRNKTTEKNINKKCRHKYQCNITSTCSFYTAKYSILIISQNYWNPSRDRWGVDNQSITDYDGIN